MLSSLPPIVLCLLAILAPGAISMYSVKKILFMARERKLYDVPDNIRKIHGAQIPSLGGVGIFVGFMAMAPFFIGSSIKGWPYIVLSTVILFFTGIYDDIMNMSPLKKLLAQLIASAVTVIFADIRLTHLGPILGLGLLPYWVSVGLTVFLSAFFINVYNFIDGIDGLAAITNIISSLVLGGLFIYIHSLPMAYVCFCLAGASAGLLYYNYAPAKIYMGDTGSMFSGAILFILALIFINQAADPLVAVTPLCSLQSSFYLVLSIFFLPVFDALRVFALRISHGQSPLRADRRHLHYYLIDGGYSHAAAVWLLTATSILTILIGFAMAWFDLKAFVAVPAILQPFGLLAGYAGRLKKG